jgi:hypothetical protein
MMLIAIRIIHDFMEITKLSLTDSDEFFMFAVTMHAVIFSEVGASVAHFVRALIVEQICTSHELR